MSDSQVAEMREAFRDDISERQKQYVDTPLPKQIARRTERMEKRLTPWFGELTPVQKQRVHRPGPKRWAIRTENGSPTGPTGSSNCCWR
jgi:hypothetical protein